jgi:hypothetical protein
MLGLRPRAQVGGALARGPREGPARDVGRALGEPADGIDAHLRRPQQQGDGDREQLRADQADDRHQRDARGDAAETMAEAHVEASTAAVNM